MRATTSSLNSGELYLPFADQYFDGKKVDRVYVDERWRTGELHFIRICARLRRGSPWNGVWDRSRPGRPRPNSCLVCFDCKLFLRATPAEGTLSKGKRTQIPLP